jgi:hypothetical protein
VLDEPAFGIVLPNGGEGSARAWSAEQLFESFSPYCVTCCRRHVPQRTWLPAPGAVGAVPSVPDSGCPMRYVAVMDPLFVSLEPLLFEILIDVADM